MGNRIVWHDEEGSFVAWFHAGGPAERVVIRRCLLGGWELVIGAGTVDPSIYPDPANSGQRGLELETCKRRARRWADDLDMRPLPEAPSGAERRIGERLARRIVVDDRPGQPDWADGLNGIVATPAQCGESDRAPAGLIAIARDGAVIRPGQSTGGDTATVWVD
jgi:hypothetical protein